MTKHSDAHDLQASVEEVTVAADSAAKNRLHEFKEKAVKLQEQATEYVKEGYGKAKDKSLEVEDKVTTYVRGNPIKTIGISVLAGAVLAKIFRSRK